MDYLVCLKWAVRGVIIDVNNIYYLQLGFHPVAVNNLNVYSL
jgi:hypothetical protein